MSMPFRRTKGARKSHPITPRGNTIYGPPESKQLAGEVHARSEADARRSAASLEKDFRESKTREKKVHVYRATLEEANRLEIGSNNSNNSPEARMRLRKEEGIFRAKADSMHRSLYG